MSEPVCLVQMPYASLARPSLALSLLKSALADVGIDAHVIYANLLFAERIGLRTYTLFSHLTPQEFMSGDWSFAAAAFPDRDEHLDDTYLDCVSAASFEVFGYAGASGGERLRADLLAVRAEANAFIGDLARTIIESRPRVVGCTSTFEQHVASLALLRELKRLDPEVVTIMGGANCETVMGAATHRNFPWVDYVVSGEADKLVGPLMLLILEHHGKVPVSALPEGVLGPGHREFTIGKKARLSRVLFRDLDNQPIPDFRDYFAQLAPSSVASAINPGLPIETSRGCWWGQIKHCTFCGLNGSGMTYRSKSARRALDELELLAAKYGIQQFEAVDNIMDMRFFTEFLPELVENDAPYSLFYEIKSNLKQEHVGQLQAAGVTWVQPGVESLHSDFLALIDKGVQGWQHIQLLKWAREQGVRLSWSILWGFPGEADAWFEEMAQWVPALEHLQAPLGVSRLRIDRFSVYHTDPERFGLVLRPGSAMRFIYPLSESEQMDLAYYFLEEGAPEYFGSVGPLLHDGVFDDRQGVTLLRNRVKDWSRRFWRQPPLLSLSEVGEEVHVLDTRSCAVNVRHRLDGVERAVILACDSAPFREQVPLLVTELLGFEPSLGEVEAAVAKLLKSRLLLSMDRRMINLAIREDLRALPEVHEFPGGTVNGHPR